jgi:hypothetical protein
MDSSTDLPYFRGIIAADHPGQQQTLVHQLVQRVEQCRRPGLGVASGCLKN